MNDCFWRSSSVKSRNGLFFSLYTYLNSFRPMIDELKNNVQDELYIYMFLFRTRRGRLQKVLKNRTKNKWNVGFYKSKSLFASSNICKTFEIFVKYLNGSKNICWKFKFQTCVHLRSLVRIRDNCCHLNGECICEIEKYLTIIWIIRLKHVTFLDLFLKSFFA